MFLTDRLSRVAGLIAVSTAQTQGRGSTAAQECQMELCCKSMRTTHQESEYRRLPRCSRRDWSHRDPVDAHQCTADKGAQLSRLTRGLEILLPVRIRLVVRLIAGFFLCLDDIDVILAGNAIRSCSVWNVASSLEESGQVRVFLG